MWTKRAFDFVLALALTVVLSPVLAIVVFLIRFTSKGPAIHWSSRVGKDNRLFQMPKFRSMRVDAPQLATHLMTNAQAYVTPVGNFLRRTSLDELPQLYSILRGELSFVGPRPALFNQKDLIAFRTELGIQHLTPGLTGWAQINGRDDLPIRQKVQFDYEYFKRCSFRFDLQILMLTITKVIRKEGIAH